MKIGILLQTKKAKEETEKAAESEKVQLAVTSAIMNLSDNQITIENLSNELKNNNLDKNKLIETPSGFRYIGIQNDYKINFSGSIKELEKNQIDNEDLIIGTIVNNYTCQQENDIKGNAIEWKIFCVDGNDVYLIPNVATEKRILETSARKKDEEDTFFYSGFKILEEFNKTELELYKDTRFPIYNTNLINSIKNLQNATIARDKATEYLLDSTNWEEYTNSNYSDWAIGAPTTEMLQLSLEQQQIQKGTETTLTITNDDTKVYLRLNNFNQSTLCFFDAEYRLACPASSNWAMTYVVRSSGLWDCDYRRDGWLRPIVKINSSINFFEDGTNYFMK